MRVCTFASGSTGNCTLVSDGDTHILIDAGISMRRIKSHLAELDLVPGQLAGVLITHEHSDHISGLATMVKQHRLPLFAPDRTAVRLRRMLPGAEVRGVLPGECFDLEGLEILAFPTLHDTPQSVGYRIRGDVDFGFCTDLGCVTDEVLDSLQGVSAALIEANHDREMLLRGGYPYALKMRILSDRGHLSNEHSGALAAFLAEHGAETIILGHLSRENNRPELALSAVRRILAEVEQSPDVLVAPAAEPLRVELGEAYAGSQAHLCGQNEGKTLY